MTTQTPDALAASRDRQTAPFERAVGLWLLVCAAMVFLMAVIGAITRLTESGLSIMEWAPVTGILPPLSQDEWLRLFALYQQIPEYQVENAGMTLAEFKTIFWWEYIHRLWGRLIGLVFALPFLWFLVRGRLRHGLAPKLLGVFALGGLQGLMGWIMVASGFAERTDVSQYRLVAHLALALLIYGALILLAARLLSPPPAFSTERRAAALKRALAGFGVLVFVTALSGGFVAGLNAGLIYNTFPLMDGALVPADYGGAGPWWLAPFESVAAVQFNHRILAIITLAAALGLWHRSRPLHLGRGAAKAIALMAAMALLQLGLGIATLLLVVPAWLAALHQAGALVLLALALWAWQQVTPAQAPRQTGQRAGRPS
jgi:cytochrome c oxidase assembly protein subunit 15